MPLWEVIGGGDKGGILVREGEGLSSPKCSERLSTGARVEELKLAGDRIHYRLVEGAGPQEGWVALEVSGKVLLQKLEEDGGDDAGAGESAGTPPDYPDKSTWTIKPGDVELPPAMPAPPRPAHLTEVSPLPPWTKPQTGKGETAETIINKVTKGEFYKADFPYTVKMLFSDPKWGATWLTKAFHTAGTLPKDNKVAKVVNWVELPFSGYDAAGGAGMKGLFTVKYAKSDPNLHTDLFVKVPFNQDNNMTWRMNMSFFGDPDGGELCAYQFLQHLLPFRTPKMYYVDMNRSTTNYIIITEQIPFAKRGTKTFEPYQVIPTVGKFQDFELPDTCQPVYALFRAMARMIAWDKQGRFEGVREIFEHTTYARMGGRDGVVASREGNKQGKAAATPEQRLEWRKGQMLEAMANSAKTEKRMLKSIDTFVKFVAETAPCLFTKDCRNSRYLEQFKKQMMKMHQLSGAIGFWCGENDGHDELYGLIHPNLQIDNAFFWQDEEGMYHAGILDWGGAGYYDYSQVFLNIVSTAQPQHYLEHEEKWFQCFTDELKRWGGPELDPAMLVRLSRLGFASGMAGSCQTTAVNAFSLATEEEWKGVKDEFHEVVMDRWNVRCSVMDARIKMQVWKNGPHWQTVLDWAKELGLPTDPF